MVVVTVVGILVAWAAIFGGDRWSRVQQSRKPTPESLFGYLCRLHRLSRSELQLLNRLVASRSLANPAVVFTNPMYMDEFGLANGEDRNSCDKLKRKLFGDVSQTPAEAVAI